MKYYTMRRTLPIKNFIQVNKMHVKENGIIPAFIFVVGYKLPIRSELWEQLHW